MANISERKGKLIGAERRALELTVTGMRQDEVARETGLCRTTLWKLRGREEAKRYLEEQTGRLMEALPDIVGGVISDIEFSGKLRKWLKGEEGAENGSRLKGVDEVMKYLEGVAKKETEVMKALGMYPAGSASIVIQQIFQQIRNETVISPDVMRIMGPLMEKMAAVEEKEVIEAETAEGS